MQIVYTYRRDTHTRTAVYNMYIIYVLDVYVVNDIAILLRYFNTQFDWVHFRLFINVLHDIYAFTCVLYIYILFQRPKWDF